MEAIQRHDVTQKYHVLLEMGQQNICQDFVINLKSYLEIDEKNVLSNKEIETIQMNIYFGILYQE